jgi:hypothetical protein
MKISPDMKTRRIARKELEFLVYEPFTLEHVNVDALVALGVQPAGVVRQLNQVTVENLGNAIRSRIVSAESAGSSAPDQSVMDQVMANYDFSGVRAASTEEGLPEDLKLQYSIARDNLRDYARNGNFSADGSSQTIQTVKDSDEGVLKPGKMSLDEFESLVACCIEGLAWEGPVITKANNPARIGQPLVIDFGVEPVFDGEIPGNYGAFREQVMTLAAEKLAENQRRKAAAAALQNG